MFVSKTVSEKNSATSQCQCHEGHSPTELTLNSFKTFDISLKTTSENMP